MALTTRHVSMRTATRSAASTRLARHVRPAAPGAAGVVRCSTNRRTAVVTRAFKEGTTATDKKKQHTEYAQLYHNCDHDDHEEQGPGALMQRAKSLVRPLPLSLTDFLVPLGGAGIGAAFAATHDLQSAAIGLGAGVVARVLQALLLEQSVPFTGRKHTLLLPVGIETTMGAASYQKILAQPEYAKGILSHDHPDSKLITRISEKIIGVVEQQHGGGFQDHIQKFEWEVVVVKNEVPNAFVLPGGKIVVFTGIIDLLNRDEDMLATIIGHECAHALARHGTEKISLGIFVAVALQLAYFLVNRNFNRGGNDPRQQRGYQQGYPGRGGNPGPGYPGGGYRGPIGRSGYPTRMPRYYSPAVADGGMAAGPFGGLGGLGAGPRGGLTPQLVQLGVNLFLQLPFSRRAEAEADLIGLKLMSLAGYNEQVAPRTFELMDAYQKKKGGSAAANASYVQTHPRSSSRVQLLLGELEKMKADRKVGKEKVLSKVPYWML